MEEYGFSLSDITSALNELCSGKRDKNTGTVLHKPEIVRYERKIREKEDKKIKNQEKEIFYGLYDIVSDYGRLCPECGSPYILQDYTFGEEVCYDCGLVLKEYITTPDWKKVNPPEDPLYVDDTYKLLLKDKSPKRRAWVYREIFSESDLHLRKKVLPELRRICDNLRTPQHVRRHAVVIYIKVLKKGLIRQNVNYRPYLLAALVLAYRSSRIPVDINSLGLPKRVIIKAIKNIIKVLDKKDLEYIHYQELSAKEYVAFLVSRLEIEFKSMERYELSRKAIRILERLNPVLSGKNPKLVAAVAIYTAANALKIPISQRILSEIAGVSVERISKLYQKFRLEYTQKSNYLESH